MASESPTIGHVPGDLWAEVAPLLGEEGAPGTRGRPPILFTRASVGHCTCSGRDASEKLSRRSSGQAQLLTEGSSRAGERVFRKLWVTLLRKCGELRGIGLRWQSLDWRSVKAPLGATRQASTLRTGQARDEKAHPDRPEGDAPLDRHHSHEQPRPGGTQRARCWMGARRPPTTSSLTT